MMEVKQTNGHVLPRITCGTMEEAVISVHFPCSVMGRKYGLCRGARESAYKVTSILFLTTFVSGAHYLTHRGSLTI